MDIKKIPHLAKTGANIQHYEIGLESKLSNTESILINTVFDKMIVNKIFHTFTMQPNAEYMRKKHLLILIFHPKL